MLISTIVISLCLLTILVNISIYYTINKLYISQQKKNDTIQAKKICAWIECVCDTENIESSIDDRSLSTKFWGIVIANYSKSMIYDIKIVVEEIQSDRTINIHRTINLLPPGDFYCKRLYAPSKLPFDLPKRLTTFNELINLHDDNTEHKATRPMTTGKKKIVKLEFRDSNNNSWEKNEFGNLKQTN